MENKKAELIFKSFFFFLKGKDQENLLFLYIFSNEKLKNYYIQMHKSLINNDEDNYNKILKLMQTEIIKTLKE